MSTGAVFAAQITAWSRKVDLGVEEFRRAVLIELFSSISTGTPVLSGRLRANWQTSLASPAAGAVGIRPPEEVTAEIMRVLGEAKGDVTIYFVNNLPYAYRIEFEGWSKDKHPEGMVRVNLERITAIVADHLAKARA